MSQIQLSKTQPAVFSWSPDDLSVLQNLSKLSIGTIFQEIPKGWEEATLKLLSVNVMVGKNQKIPAKIVCVRIFFIQFHNYQKWNVFWC